ncbi:hypothetical protein EJ04DRAFT_439889 [Polyplosphaeria fusca]|uniref:Uncharacterized protein n=1 Tax=Polyplosphaeria fusca TaxID=682080 RepID=A0A9P4QSM2_9PLEO|nr:hypothetical protein EJ04DRAFT_439889 [Polyplosphaeria fusca]
MARRKTQVTSPRVQFLFVDNAQPSTANQKRRIRQHTMRKVAASRKELGTYEKYNVGQYPVFTDNAPCTVKQDVQAVVVPLDSSDDQKEDCIVQWSMPAQGYERARILFDFDLISLSTLTSIHFNRASAKVLSADRSRLRLLLASATDASYLVFVPQLYGQSTLIRLVVDCVLARAKQAVAEDACMHEQRILQLYCKALAALQSALMDKKRMFEPEVLCATHLLAIFELLDRTSTSRWESHISGLLELLQLRGPHRYTTPIERLLLSSCLGTIVRPSPSPPPFPHLTPTPPVLRLHNHKPRLLPRAPPLDPPPNLPPPFPNHIPLPLDNRRPDPPPLPQNHKIHPLLPDPVSRTRDIAYAALPSRSHTHHVLARRRRAGAAHVHGSARQAVAPRECGREYCGADHGAATHGCAGSGGK